ncbi:MAG: MmgE/PrpD family protein [Flavobacteriaceae bacterium]
MTIAARLADYVTTTRIEEFDDIVIERAKDLCLSSIGSAVLGADMDVATVMADYVKAQGARGEAGVIGVSFRTSVELAAMLNCDFSHCTELEDVAWPEAQYTCCLIPAVFTLGEALGASGKAVLEAMIIGFEVAARPGMTLSNGGAAARGFLSCANVGTIGVAAAAAKLMGLNVERTQAALTLAASVGGGLVRQTGSSAHVVEAGFAARDGIMAAELARRGLGGNPTIMDGKAGYFDALAGQPDLAIAPGTGSDLRIMAVGQKKYPCCYMLQRIIDETKDMVAANAIVADEVAEVRVEVNAAFPTIMKYPEPGDVEEARFSLPHVVAATLVGEPMDVRTFSADKLDDPRIVAQRGKVTMIVHEEWGHDQLGAKDHIAVVMRDGRRFEAVATVARGDAVNPLSREETIAKFLTCTDGRLPATLQQETAQNLATLENVAYVAPMMDALTFAQVEAAAA